MLQNPLGATNQCVSLCLKWPLSSSSSSSNHNLDNTERERERRWCGGGSVCSPPRPSFPPSFYLGCLHALALIDCRPPPAATGEGGAARSDFHRWRRPFDEHRDTLVFLTQISGEGSELHVNVFKLFKYVLFLMNISRIC